MSLDLRSQMAVNLCAGLEGSPGEKFRALAHICHKWGFGLDEAMPLAYALKEKLGISDVKAYEAMRAVCDGQEIILRRMN